MFYIACKCNFLAVYNSGLDQIQGEILTKPNQLFYFFYQSFCVIFIEETEQIRMVRLV